MTEFLFGVTVGILVCMPILFLTLPLWINTRRAVKYLEGEIAKPMPEPVPDDETKTVLEEANRILSSCSESKSQKGVLTKSSQDSESLTSQSKAS